MGKEFHILFLAPEPFYEERGTPIAVDLMLKVLSDRGIRVDVLTYHEGADVEYPHVTVHRIAAIPFVNGIRPGFSWKKVVCDVLMLWKAIRFVSRKRYHVVHAVEESVFVALIIKLVFGIPYVYDMDSSLAEQMVEQYPRLRILGKVLDYCEGIAAKHAKVIVPVSETLADRVKRYNPEKIVVIHDVSLMQSVAG